MPRGRVRLYTADEAGGAWRLVHERPNQLQHAWGFVACLSLGRGDRRYRIGGMYVEFANVASPGDTVTPPAYGKGEGREYYEALAADRDYLRIPLKGEPAIEIAPGYEAYFEDGVSGNRLVCVGVTAGTAGVNGLPFSDAANSVVYGLALVAVPERGDRTQDVVFARKYYAAADQVPKAAGRQIALVWEQDFTEEG